MTRWLGICLCILTVLAVTDMHLMLMQGVAWGTMLQDRAPERGVAEALDSTFSGTEPCPMCCAVQQERNEEQEEAPVPEANPLVKWIPVTDQGRFLLYLPHGRYLCRRPDLSLLLIVRKEMPDVPPPQVQG